MTIENPGIENPVGVYKKENSAPPKHKIYYHRQNTIAEHRVWVPDNAIYSNW